MAVMFDKCKEADTKEAADVFCGLRMVTRYINTRLCESTNIHLSVTEKKTFKQIKRVCAVTRRCTLMILRTKLMK